MQIGGETPASVSGKVVGCEKSVVVSEELGAVVDSRVNLVVVGSVVEAGIVEAEVIEAEVAEAEVVEAEVVEAEVAEAEVVEARIAEAGVVASVLSVEEGASEQANPLGPQSIPACSACTRLTPFKNGRHPSLTRHAFWLKIDSKALPEGLANSFKMAGGVLLP